MRLVTSVARGVVAGIAGTTAMTAYQLGVAKLRGQPLHTPVPRTWKEAPAPAQLAKRAAQALGEGRKVTKQDVPLVTNAVHWLYGVTWGGIYGAAAGMLKPNPIAGGLSFGAGVWGAAYAELVPLGIYDPPWKYPLKELAVDLSYHLVYGTTVAGAYALLDR